MTEQSQNRVLVEHARSGRPDAITALYHLYAKMMYGVACRLTGSVQDAEDVVQDVFVGLPAALRTYEHRDQLEKWLKTLTVRASLMSLRAQRRRREVAYAEAPPSATSIESPAVLDLVAFEQAVRRLPDQSREVFVLKVVEGYSHAEIGELLGITIAHSRLNLHRARQQLERELRSK